MKNLDLAIVHFLLLDGGDLLDGLFGQVLAFDAEVKQRGDDGQIVSFRAPAGLHPVQPRLQHRSRHASDVQLKDIGEAVQAGVQVFQVNFGELRGALGREHFVNDLAHGAFFEGRGIATAEKIHGLFQCCAVWQVFHGGDVFEHGEIERHVLAGATGRWPAHINRPICGSQPERFVFSTWPTWLR